MDNNPENSSVYTYSRRDITPDEQAKMLTTAYQKDEVLCRGLALGLLSGLHRYEFLDLRYRDIDTKTMTIDISSTVITKPRTTRVITLTDTLAAWLAVFRPGAPDRRVVPFTTWKYNDRLHKLLRVAGLGPYSNDFLRRAFNAHLARTLPPLADQRAMLLHTYGASGVRVHFYRTGTEIFPNLSPAALKVGPYSTQVSTSLSKALV
jgi:integrase